MSRLQRWLLKIYGTSQREQDERTRQTAEAIQRRANERNAELEERSEIYSRTIADAYTRREGR